MVLLLLSNIFAFGDKVLRLINKDIYFLYGFCACRWAINLQSDNKYQQMKLIYTYNPCRKSWTNNIWGLKVEPASSTLETVMVLLPSKL